MPALQGGTLADAIARPLDVVRQLFLQAGHPDGGDDDWGVEAHFRSLMQDPAALEQVPLLTADTIDQIPNNSLCRYRGMIQDMMDPEYYVGAFRQPHGGWATAKYADSPPEAIPADAETRVWDRKPVYCTAVPGASAWTLPAASAPVAATTTQLAPQPAPATAAPAKRAREEEADVAMKDAEAPAAAKAARPEAPAATEPKDAPAPAFPEPREGDCLVFLYGREEGCKLNEAVEVVGVLSRLPERAALQLRLAGREQPADFMEEAAAAIPPTSLVPRLHALTAARLTGGEGLPLIACKDAPQRRQQLRALRAAALDRLAAALCGDRLAAEYLLLQLTARVHMRPEGGATALGLFSLGLTNCPAAEPAPAAAEQLPLGSPEALSPFGRGVLAALSGLHPRVVGLPLAVPELNRRTWRPARDLKTGRLLAAPLQLAEGTQVLLDETRLAAGQLSALGVANLKALQRLAEEQSVEYDFGFYQLPMPADAPLLLLSVGRPLLHASLGVTLPLQPLAAPGGVAAAQPEELLRPVRAYLALARGLDFAVPQPVTAFLEEELVRARKEDTSLQPAAMHTWLTLARLLALSHGDDELSREHWAEMQRLEHLRQQRLRGAK